MSTDSDQNKGSSSFNCHKEMETSQKNLPIEYNIDEIIQYRCPDCPRTFANQVTLTCHMKEAHCDGKQIKCEVCWKVFTTKSKLARHMRTHTGQKPFECQTCGLGFSLKTNLKRHQYIHLTEKKFKCEKCPDERFFQSPAQLNQHMVIHGAKRYKCYHCDKMFHRSGDLKIHERIHINLKPFGCEICEKRFYTSSHMKHHLKAAHTSRAPIKCETCGKHFAHSAALKCHMLTHTGAKSHKCEKCGNCFTARSSVNRHMKKCAFS